MNPLRKVIAGGEQRISRLHDEKGRLMPLSDLRYVPRSVGYIFGRKLADKLPELPWFTFTAIRRIEQIIQPTWKMIEFGSGMSTKWFAERVATIHSIESNPTWYARVAPTLPKNARYELRAREHYADVSEYQDGHFDFAVVDGEVRADCMRSVLPKIKCGGYIYFDDSDKDMTIPNGDCRIAEQLLIAACEARNGKAEHILGLAVGALAAHEGILAKLN
jgi:hypothetical protein